MWDVLWRNPQAIFLAILLHLLIAMSLFFRQISSKPATDLETPGQVIQAQIVNSTLVKHSTQRLANLEAKQYAMVLRAQTEAAAMQRRVEAEQQKKLLLIERHTKRQQQLAEEEARLTRKIQREQVAAVARQQAEKQRQEAAEKTQQIAIQQQKLAAQVERQVELERQRIAAKQAAKRQAELARQRVAVDAAARHQAELERQRVAATAAASHQAELERQRIESGIRTRRESKLKRQLEIQEQARQESELYRQLMAKETARLTELNALQSGLAAEQNERDQQELAAIQSQIYEKIRSNWRIPSFNETLHCTLRVHINTKGEVIGVKILESSGNTLFDDAADRAVHRATPLPIPKEQRLFDEFLVLVFDPIRE